MLNQCRISGFADEISGSVAEQIALLKKLDIKYIEFRSSDGIGVSDYTPAQARELKKRLDDAGIAVSSAGSPIGKIPINGDMDAHMELLKRTMEVSRILDTRYIRMFSFFMPKGEDPAGYRGEVMERMGRMVEAAKAEDMVLCHENEKGIYGEKADGCLDLMKTFYGDNFKCIFDFANFIQAGQETMEAYRMLAPYIIYLHVKDAQAGTGVVKPAGYGDGRLPEILSLLDKDGFNGFLSLEPHLGEPIRMKWMGEEKIMDIFRRVKALPLDAVRKDKELAPWWIFTFFPEELVRTQVRAVADWDYSDLLTPEENVPGALTAGETAYILSCRALRKLLAR